MRDMYTVSATDVRNHWSETMDRVVREKPAFIKRTRDCVVLANEDLFRDMLSAYTFSAVRYTEDEAKLKLAESILDYAADFYNDFAYWSAAANRKAHVPYVLRAIMLDDIHKIGECISCQAGKN